MRNALLADRADRILARLFPTRFRAGAPEGRHGRVGAPHLWRMQRAFQIDFLQSRGLAKQHQLLDLGCGTLRGGLPLIGYLSAGNYTGIDVRAEIIEEALRELEDAGLEQRYPRIGHVESLAGLDLRATYDYIWAFDRLSGRNKWRLKTGTAVLSSPAYADGILYCGSDDRHLYALDAETGAEKWRYATAGWVQSAPAVRAGQVFYGSYDGAVYANDARTGILNWRFRTGGHVVSSPAVDDRAVYFGSYDGHLYAVHVTQGTRLWRFAAAGGVLSSPVVVDGAVYFGSTGGKFYALE